jgi:ketosteroid isomerase-like protein
MFIWWNLGDREMVEEALDPEIEIHTPLSSTRGVPYRGRSGVEQWIQDIDDQFEDWYSRPEEWIEVDDGRVLVLGELHLRGRESGVELDQAMGWMLTFRDGRLFRCEVFLDHEQARQAAGLAAS